MGDGRTAFTHTLAHPFCTHSISFHSTQQRSIYNSLVGGGESREKKTVDPKNKCGNNVDDDAVDETIQSEANKTR